MACSSWRSLTETFGAFTLAAAAGLAASVVGCAHAETDPNADASIPREHGAPPVVAATDTLSPSDGDGAPPGHRLDFYPPGAVATFAENQTDPLHTQVAIYAAQPDAQSKPIATLSVAAPPGWVSQIAFDDQRRLYTLEFSGKVSVFASGASGLASPVRVINAGGLYGVNDVSYALGLGVDHRKNVYITINTQLHAEGPESILVYGADASGLASDVAPSAPGGVGPSRTISGPHTRLELPIHIGFDADDHLFVGDYFASKVFVFAKEANGDEAPARVACATLGFQAMAVAPNGTLYVAPEGVPDWSIQVFEPDTGNGPQKVAGAIKGPSTGFEDPSHGPLALAIDPWGGIEVISSDGGFQFGEALGNVAPLRSFSGWNALAVAPRGPND